ncbi:MAG: UDP-3-O-acyl-N-acetylglucosamine deacetylase [Phycisphaerae bacterium]|nr:UDP-3-O-acyl-N-acetylglucosamine deacetylase [Phycisphaerae bacterium]
MKPQCTIEKTAEIRGRGLFTGEQVTLRFNPAPADSGIVFVRADAPSPVRIPAHVENVTKRSRRTSLRNGTLSIETVEHCLAAMHGLGIDNVEIELTGGELPGGDGSSQVFVDALQSAGIVDLPAERHPLVIDQTIRVAEGDAELIALPGSPEELNILYDLDYGDSGPIRRQIYALRLSPESFCREIAPARTFVLEEEAQQFRAAGLGLHLTYSDLVVIGQNGVVENEFRFENECVRHKILDLIGDLMLAGRPIYGKIIARKSGHSLNHELVRKLLEALEARELSRLLGREPVLDVRKIQRILPHRYPFLLVDRVLEIEGDRRAVGLKNVSINEEFFQGHYPAQPIMPGVLIIEAMAQLAGLLLSQKLEHTGKVAVLLAMDGVKFRRPVIPGDQLILEARTLRVRSRTGHVQCSARVGDAMVAQAEIKFMLVDAEPQ